MEGRGPENRSVADCGIFSPEGLGTKERRSWAMPLGWAHAFPSQAENGGVKVLFRLDPRHPASEGER